MNISFYFLLTLIITTFTFNAHSYWLVRPSAGSVYTSNANYDDEETEDDIYLFAQSFASYANDKRSWNIWASYQDYSEESQNDSANWRLSLVNPIEISQSKWDLDVGFGGNHFINDDPANFEDGFSYYFIDAYLIKEAKLADRWTLIFDPSYRFKEYYDFDGRSDHRAALSSEIEFKPNDFNEIGFLSSAGANYSTDSVYSHYFLLLGLDWDHKLKNNFSIESSASVKWTTFPERSVFEQTAITVSNGNGNGNNGNGNGNQGGTETILVTNEEDEAYTSYSISSYLKKKFSSFSVLAGAFYNTQSSKSDLQDYDVLGFKGSLVTTF